MYAPSRAYAVMIRVSASWTMKYRPNDPYPHFYYNYVYQYATSLLHGNPGVRAGEANVITRYRISAAGAGLSYRPAEESRRDMTTSQPLDATYGLTE
jgi:hypothetical protein